jgi:hypothetical protein
MKEWNEENVMGLIVSWLENRNKEGYEKTWVKKIHRRFWNEGEDGFEEAWEKMFDSLLTEYDQTIDQFLDMMKKLMEEEGRWFRHSRTSTASFEEMERIQQKRTVCFERLKRFRSQRERVKALARPDWLRMILDEEG